MRLKVEQALNSEKNKLAHMAQTWYNTFTICILWRVESHTLHYFPVRAERPGKSRFKKSFLTGEDKEQISLYWKVTKPDRPGHVTLPF